MKFTKNTKVKLKSFLGTLSSENLVASNENYWKLIGEKGKVIDDVDINNGRILILFDINLDELDLENHYPIKNSIWILKSDLEII